MADIYPPYRGKAAVIGIFGGVVGALALRYWQREIAPVQFEAPESRAVLALPGTSDPVESISPIPAQYREGETAFDTAARVFFRLFNGRDPLPEEAAQSDELLHLAYFAFVGVAYGGSRTSRRPRDIAGSFFFGIRLWAAETFAGAFLGFRPGPTRFTFQQHFRRLVDYWVYTFVSNNLTRAIYWLLTPEHRGDPTEKRRWRR